MSEQANIIKSKVEKICLDNDCSEHYENHPPEAMDFMKDFIYCPYCSEELHLQCKACKESLSRKDYRFCPWCGAGFDE